LDRHQVDPDPPGSAAAWFCPPRWARPAQPAGPIKAQSPNPQRGDAHQSRGKVANNLKGAYGASILKLWNLIYHTMSWQQTMRPSARDTRDQVSCLDVQT